MPQLESAVDTTAAAYRANRAHQEHLLEQLAQDLATANAGGGDRYVRRHTDRGRLLPRQRIELLIDAFSPLLELSPLAAWGTDFHVGASVVTAVGVVNGTACMLIANDPTVKGGASNPWTLKKVARALQIARENRLPVVNLVESGGADLPTQAEIFIPGGAMFRDLTRLSAAGVPTVALVFGNSTAGGAYVPGMSDYTVHVAEQSKVFLGGPALVRLATGEEADAEELGGARMHARRSGLADYLAADEHEALRLGRQIVRRLGSGLHRGRRPGTAEPIGPRYDPDELLGIVSADLREEFDPRDVLARIVDESLFDAFKPAYGPALVTGWARLHGHDIGVLANHHGVLFGEESQKAAQFIQLANNAGTPLVFLQNTTGYMVGTEYEQRGIIKDGAKMINAVANSSVPHLTVVMGASYGAGNYGMCGRAYEPRFLFSWPGAKSAVMGPAQLAGVLSLVGRQAAAAGGKAFDEEADAQMRRAVTEQIEKESLAPFLSGRLYDDGIIDPRDTRTVLGLCLDVVDGVAAGSAPGRYGVFRM